jgi:acetyl esterase/lipase
VLGEDPTNPYISPLYGDLTGLPPILVQVSSSEMLYSDGVRFVEKAKEAGVDATLQTWDDTLHVFQMFGLNEFPETDEALQEIGKFAKGLMS